MTKIDIARVPERKGSSYPAPFDKPCAARVRKQLGDAAGLTDFGVNLLRLPPGAWSSQRHWHDAEDEFTYVLSGEVVLVTDATETDVTIYPDIDMKYDPKLGGYVHKNGTPYPK